jgi:hypothetical protein
MCSREDRVQYKKKKNLKANKIKKKWFFLLIFSPFPSPRRRARGSGVVSVTVPRNEIPLHESKSTGFV